MTTDRLAQGYEPNFDIDVAVGHQGELYVANVVDALRSGSSIEVKTDDAAAKWRRVYFEYQCLYRDGYRPSGLATTSAELWAEVLVGDVLIVAPTWRFRRVANLMARTPGLRKELTRGSHPTKGVVVPLDKLLGLLMDAAPVADPAKPAEWNAS